MSVGTNESERVRSQGRLLPYSHNCRLQALPGVTSSSPRKNWVPGLAQLSHKRTFENTSYSAYYTVRCSRGPYVQGCTGMFNARTRSAISGPTAGRCSCRCRPLKPHWSSTLSYLKVALGVVRVLEIAPPPSPIFYLEGRSNTRFKPRPTKGQRPSATLLAKHALHISIIYRLACPIFVFITVFKSAHHNRGMARSASVDRAPSAQS